jgi:hypothetical protein
MAARKINVNLAARPLRNRRFFFSLVGGTVALFLLVAALALATQFTAKARAQTLAASLASIRKETASAKQDRDTWMAQIREWAKTYRTTIDALNSVLVDKRFSWLEFLSRLEESMPPACVIVQMLPLVARDGTVDARFKVSCPSLQDLLAFIQNLNGEGFKNISVRQEAQLNGQWVSEILFTHARTY